MHTDPTVWGGGDGGRAQGVLLACLGQIWSPAARLGLLFIPMIHSPNSSQGEPFSFLILPTRVSFHFLFTSRVFQGKSSAPKNSRALTSLLFPQSTLKWLRNDDFIITKNSNLMVTYGYLMVTCLRISLQLFLAFRKEAAEDEMVS